MLGFVTVADWVSEATTRSPDRNEFPSATLPGITSATEICCSTFLTFNFATTSLPRFTSRSALANTPPELPLLTGASI